MTVTYTYEVASCRGFGCFWKLLFRWRGSIYKLVWPDLFLYTCLYYAISFVYRFSLNADQRRYFEEVCLYCESFSDLIPVSFVLGFYVSVVVQRWWSQYESLPWPDSLSLFISTALHGDDDRARLMRRTIVRYANLAFTLTLAMVSPQIKKRFPTLDHLVEAGLMNSNEKKILEKVMSKSGTKTIYWMPLVWAGTVVSRARKEGRILDDFAVKTIIDEINRLRGLCGALLGYDWISIPLVYTQVVTLAVYTFFLATLMGRQFLDPTKKYAQHTIDFYFPIFTYLQFFFYMGWLKVAESLVNPFGEDDDDFEINWLIDRNVQISYLIVDEMHDEHPELTQDLYWDEVFPQELPYTIAAQEFKIEPPQGSTVNVEVPEHQQEYLPVLSEATESDAVQESTLRPPDLRRISSIASSFRRKPSAMSFLQGIFAPSTTPDKVGDLGRIESSAMLQVPSQRAFKRSVSKSSPSTTSPALSQHKRDSDIFQMSDVSLDSMDAGEDARPTRASKPGKSRTAPRRQHRKATALAYETPDEDEEILVPTSNASNKGDSDNQPLDSAARVLP